MKIVELVYKLLHNAYSLTFLALALYLFYSTRNLSINESQEEYQLFKFQSIIQVPYRLFQNV